MSDLWSGKRTEARAKVQPLALRMRPRSLDEVVGQRHILGDPADNSEKPLLRRMIESGVLTSIIFHGPPGTGKTTLAEVIALETGRTFVRENAASVGVARIREVLDDSKRRIEEGGKPVILFLDEIHRFTRAQQDVLLEDVERGLITLIGATTENPMFAVNSALVSRSTMFRLEPLSIDDIKSVIRRAITDPGRGYGLLNLRITDDAVDHWAEISDGDARRALNALEVAVLSTTSANADSRHAASSRESQALSASPILIDLRTAEESAQRKAILYDRKGDQHYDHASALIKSLRGSDPDAALYWLALMLEAGEDPRFIARRLAILASEDIGNADPRAIMVAHACWELIERIGMPEARITLAQCVTYLALAPKSNASYLAIDEAIADVREGRTIPVPTYLRDGHKVESVNTPKDAHGYKYSHAEGAPSSVGGVTDQSYLGVEKSYYRPTEIGAEKLLKDRLEEIKRVRLRVK